MKGLFTFIVVGFLSTLIRDGLCEKPLVNRGIYTFQNKGDYGFLTSIGKTKFVTTDTWRDAATQKWRVVKGFVTSAYMLKPTSEESIAIFVNNRFVSKGSSGFGLASSQYWTVVNADKGFFQIRNLKSEECLESQGLGQQITTAPCRNAPSQQWAVHSR